MTRREEHGARKERERGSERRKGGEGRMVSENRGGECIPRAIIRDASTFTLALCPLDISADSNTIS